MLAVGENVVETLLLEWGNAGASHRMGKHYSDRKHCRDRKHCSGTIV